MKNRVFFRMSRRPWIWAALAGGMIFLLWGVLRESERDCYEHFLLSRYREIPPAAEDNGREAEPDRPEMAAWQEFFMTVDPELKRVPEEKKFEAWQVRRDLLRQKAGGTKYAWNELPVTMGGRVRTILFDPNDPMHRKVWAGAVTGGLWYNTNIHDPSQRWYTVSDVWENLSISCMAYDPVNPSTMYVGTGESQTAVTIYRESGGRGDGIWKTTDGGVSWELLPSTGHFAYISDLVVREENGTGVIYAGVVSGLYKGAQQRSSPSDGLYRSADGGLNWEQVLPVIPGSKEPYAPSDVEISAGGRLFVGTTRNLDGNGAGCVLYSDDGYSWYLYDAIRQEIMTQPNSIGTIPGRVMLAPAPSDPDIVYAVFSAGTYTPAGFIFYRAYAISRTDNQGGNWSRVGMPTDDGSWAYLAWHALVIAVDPNDPDVLYAGGLDIHKTRDAGENWKKLSDWSAMYLDHAGADYIHADQHRIAFSPGSSDTVLFGTDGGVFFSNQCSTADTLFEERSNRFNTLQFYACAMSPEAFDFFYLGGTQDNGSLLHRGETMGVRDMVSGGDGAYCFVDEDEPAKVISSVYYNRYYVFDRKLTGSLDLIHLPGETETGIFINPADYDSRTNTLYCNAMTFDGSLKDRLFRVKNITTNPVVVPVEELVPANTGSQVIFSAVRVSPFTTTHTTLYLGTQSGRLFRLTNAETASPVAGEIGSPSFPAGNISCIGIGRNENELVLSFSNYGVPSVWYTANGGGSWKDLEGNLPDMPVRWVMFHPMDPDRLLIATEAGIWESGLLSSTPMEWTPVGSGLPAVRVDMMRYRASDQTLLAATHGRGFFTNRFPAAGIEDLRASGRDGGFELFPNPSSGEVFVRSGKEARGPVRMLLFDGAGRLLEEHRLEVAFPEQLFHFTFRHPPGTYLLVLSHGQDHQGRILVLQ